MSDVHEISCMMVDVDTGEVIYQSRKDVVLFEGCYGEEYLKNVIASLFRGIHLGKNLSLICNVHEVHCEPEISDLFACCVYERQENI